MTDLQLTDAEREKILADRAADDDYAAPDVLSGAEDAKINAVRAFDGRCAQEDAQRPGLRCRLRPQHAADHDYVTADDIDRDPTHPQD